jgi:hypothetical protein
MYRKSISYGMKRSSERGKYGDKEGMNRRVVLQLPSSKMYRVEVHNSKPGQKIIVEAFYILEIYNYCRNFSLMSLLKKLFKD